MTQDFIPFARPDIGDEEISQVVDTLRSGWLTTGPKAKQFEGMMCDYLGCKNGVLVNSCTAALHLSLIASGVGPGDEVVTTPLTFAATVNTILHVGATPVLADIDLRTGNISCEQIQRKMTSKTKAIVPVHFAGLPAPMESIWKIARTHGVTVIEDAAHAIGSHYGGVPVGCLSEFACFSFYANKTLTTSEGGFLAVRDAEAAEKIRCYSLHGLSRDAWKRYSQSGTWRYDVIYPGFKYNMSDIQASLGIEQLKKLERFVERRTQLANRYRQLLSGVVGIEIPWAHSPDGISTRHSYHLFPVRVVSPAKITRDRLVDELKALGIGTAVNFIAIPSHSYYREQLGLSLSDYPVAREFSESVLSLPLYPQLQEAQVERICETLKKLIE